MNYNNKDFTPYNMAEKPSRQSLLLLPLIWSASYLMTAGSGLQIDRAGIKGLKPPFLVLSEHQGYMDYYLSPLALFPHRASYVSDMEGFAAYGKFLYSKLGCIAKRRFTSDISFIKNILHAIKKDIVVIYPEARHSNVGTNSELQESIGKLVKHLNVPVVIMKFQGSYLSQPIWDESHRRKAPFSIKLIKAFDIDETKNLSPKEITDALNLYFYYDEYKYQAENKIKIDYPKRAEGLHKVLFICKNCHSENKIESYENTLKCKNCGEIWQMDEYGQLCSKSGEMLHIPDYYEFQKGEIKKQIEQNKYSLNIKVRIEALPNEKGFVQMGDGFLRHDDSGFYLHIKNSGIELFFPNASSVQTEYDYKGKGQCIVLSTNKCCYYLYSDDEAFNVTKIQIATEIFYSIGNHKN